MADREEYQAGRVGGGVSSFQGTSLPSAGQVTGLDFSSIRNALAGWQDKLFQEREAEVMSGLETRAAVDQEQMGVSGIAETPDLARRYQQAYAQKARAIYDQQIKTDAFRMANMLRRENANDPQGFAQGWATYKEEIRKGIENSDPELAVGVEQYLDSLGAQYNERLNDSAFARELETQTAQVLEQFQDQIITMRDSLLNEPDERAYIDAKAELMANVDDAVASFLLDSGQALRLKEQINDDLSNEYVRGLANKAFEVDDYKGVQFLIEELRGGAWFDDNNKARALANELERGLPSGGVDANEIQFRSNRARDAFAAAKRGNVLSEQEIAGLQQDFAFVASYGTAADVDTFSRYLNGIAVAESYGPFIADASPEQLGAVLREMQTLDAASKLPLGYPDTVLSMVQDRDNHIATARQNVDRAALGLSAFRDTPFTEVMNMSVEDRQRFAMTQQQNRRVVAEREKLPVSQVPPWTKQQTADFSEQIQGLFGAGDSAAAYQAATAYLMPYAAEGNIIGGIAAIARINPEIAGTLRMSEALAGVDGRPAEAWFAMSMEGATVTNLPQGQRDRIRNEFRRYQSEIVALTNGQTALYGPISESMNNVMQAHSAMGGDPRQLMKSIFGNIETVSLSNGIDILKRELGDGPAEQDVAQQAINTWIRTQQSNYTTFDFDDLVPRRQEDGSFTMFDTLRQRNVTESDGVTQVRIVVDEDEIIEAKEADQGEIERMQEEALRRMDNMVELNTRQIRQYSEIGQVVGLTDDQTKRVWRAISNTPARDMQRLPDGIAPEVMSGRFSASEYERKARDALRQDRSTGRQRQLAPKEAQRAGTVVYYAELLKQFDEDERKALGALHAGADDVQAAIDAAGDDWESMLDIHARAFISRGMSGD